MKITPEDINDVCDVLSRPLYAGNERDELTVIALATILIRIYDRGHAEGMLEAQTESVIPDGYMDGPCPYTHAHTREWCGYRDCRES